MNSDQPTARPTDRLLGYCTNVHAGQDLATTQENLETHARAVLENLNQTAMGIGLWLSQKTTQQLVSSNDPMQAFAAWLNQRRLIPYTINGFPFGDFHQAVVKQKVYLPTWADPARRMYTQDLATLLVCLLQAGGASDTRQLKQHRPQPRHPGTPLSSSITTPSITTPSITTPSVNAPGVAGTISTLPIGWPGQHPPAVFPDSAKQLLQLVDFLERLEHESGQWIQVCIEPEPGCLLGDVPSVVAFFEQHLLRANARANAKTLRYLSLCYDICHAAVMNETAHGNLSLLKNAGIGIGKVQVSSAIEVDFEGLDSAQKAAALARLESFAEPRYLHQTAVYFPDATTRFFTDLPLALQDPAVHQQGRWVVHFHVPICESTAGVLGTTQSHIPQFIQAVHAHDWHPQHWEVETYAWNVLPADMQTPTLAQGIAQEIRWLKQQFAD